MTYLQLVNAILRRMRDTEVTTWDESTYSKMVGDYINDSIDIVQNAWNWSQLIVELSPTTTTSQRTMIIDGIGELGQIYQILNASPQTRLMGKTRGWMQEQIRLAGTANGSPSTWAFNSQETDGDMTIDLNPIPDDTYTLRVLCKKHQAAMSADATVLLIPDQPVIQQALAFLLEERGDTGGSNNMTQQGRADRVLADYVGLDQQRHPELLIWVDV